MRQKQMDSSQTSVLVGKLPTVLTVNEPFFCVGSFKWIGWSIRFNHESNYR